MASTWATTADNQLITGATLRNIPFYYPYTVDGVIPTEYNTRIVTNRCPTHGDFASQY